mmetsp:Transcript_25022/g.60444  ORF Transcript_25022/g.60444 Transcript_25022/m.60444 type:complete len:672 (-) Transcript_25022:220-2235(-)
MKVKKDHATSPTVVCIYCDATFCGGATRIKEHIISKCPCESESFCTLKMELIKEKEVQEAVKDLQTAEHEVRQLVTNLEENQAKSIQIQCRTSKGLKQHASYTQHESIGASMNASKAVDCDDAIAEMWYGLNIPAAKIDHPLVKKCIATLKAAPATWVPPDRKRLHGDLLERTTSRLKKEEQPVRENMLKHGCTVISDGWDDVSSAHLINILVGVSSAAFFEGTHKLTSEHSEDAAFIAKLIGDQIDRIGATSVIQVVTDTCAVMKRAWKILESRYPWITCTSCGPHVLSLELKDIGKIDQVASVIEQVAKVLSRFWGKTRWPRMRLREQAIKEFGKDIGLYRAKITRFAGKVREMGRMLRFKQVLQQTVVSTAEYGKASFNVMENARMTTVLGKDDPVKDIILDEKGFWEPLVEALQIMTPLVKLLRLLDGNAPAMGKVYARMNQIRETWEKSSVSWKDQALRIHNERCEYLFSDMHLAGYALDPEFIDKDMTHAEQTALINISERMALREEMIRLISLDKKEEAYALTTESSSVQKLTGEAMLNLASYQGKEGMLSKECVRDQAKIMPPAKWWFQFGKGVPVISKIACSVLSQPVCASAAERNWSIYGAIKSDRRSSLQHATADRLVYCHEAIHLRTKLQKVGYKEPHVRWESDSDDNGDSSDDEDLAV